VKAQDLFIRALSSAIEQNVDTSNEKIVYADCAKNGYTNPTITDLLNTLMRSLSSTHDFSNRHAPVDGIIRNHSLLGTRTVEFDEFQHFTPQRKLSITIASTYYPLDFHSRYLGFLDNPEVNKEAERVTRRQGFRRPVAGFRYDGGRMSQRAYFDTMKDYVHLSELGAGFKPTIRFSIADFGVMTESQFIMLDYNFIKEKIKQLILYTAD
jgi:hypothetical protein